MSLEMHFRASRMVRFFNLHSMLPFRIFLDVAMFSSSPMQHLRWSSMWPKKGNSWKLLLTVVTESLSLKINFNFHPAFTSWNTGKNKQTNKQTNNKTTTTTTIATLEMCQIYSKLTTKIPERVGCFHC